ncbi:META domain-containing protein [Sulfitobacter alexandrii]|uniref:META domain-containing protein n=1 Tax=Sulfitobacter alexandrii TaxID=1917485 RepID=A0A1J0WD83_9RHOB|nr:META domain-containing protein [Sulfitobacter alexandrii]APE42274.1 META domain-containing protein [Sulfitobacter alexandrii]
MILRFLLPLTALLILGACDRDETVRGHGGADREWRLVTLQGAPFDARATLSFPEEGRIAGEGPCNSYSTSNIAPYPGFDAGPIASTRRACPDLAAESAFFTMLEAATLSEVTGDTLILSDEDGALLTFKADG